MRPLKYSAWRTFVVPVLIIAGVWVLSGIRFMSNLEWRSLDWRTHVRTHFQKPADERLAVVLFEDSTENDLGHAWPVDRAFHGEMIRVLSLAGAKVVSWDVILDATREGVGDQIMGEESRRALGRGTRVVSAGVTNPDPTYTPSDQDGPTMPFSNVRGDIGKLLGDAHAFIPFPELRAASWYGFADTPPDSSGVRREIPLVVRVGDKVYPSLSLQTLLAYLEVSADQVTIKLGDSVSFEAQGRFWRLPISEGGLFLLNYRYDQSNPGRGQPAELPEQARFPVYPYGNIFLGLRGIHGGNAAPDVPPPSLKDKIVFVGQTVTGKADSGQTQLSAVSPLVLVHANVLNNVLTGDYARRMPAWLAWGLVSALAAAGMRIGVNGTPMQLAAFSVASVVGYLGLGFFLWVSLSAWLLMVGPTLALLFVLINQIMVRVKAEQRAKDQIRGSFNSYLSPALLSRVMAKGGLQSIDSERKPVTVLFTDLRDFTHWSEKTKEDVLISQLNEYLSAMVECIHQNGGTLHKFIGDAVMAVWGDLVSEGEAIDASKACNAALAMQARLAELNAKWSAEGLDTLRMGIGLNHGVVLAGNIGSPRRMEFTVIGNTVNLASRFESLNKELGTGILVGESIRDMLATQFNFKSHGGVSVKGRSKPIPVFELCEKTSQPR